MTLLNIVCSSALGVFAYLLWYLDIITIVKQRISIGRAELSRLTLHDIDYTASLLDEPKVLNCFIRSVQVRFHLPTPSLPRWFTLVSEGITYFSGTGSVSIETFSFTLWVFPVLFRHTAGPWVDVKIDGLKIQIPDGRTTPYFIQKLRTNLVNTLLRGETTRLDDFGTKLSFSGLTENTAGPEANDDNHPHLTTVTNDCKRSQTTTPGLRAPSHSQSKDELRISSYLHGFHIHNTEGRIYTFGEVEAQLRRNWVENRGSFVLVAEESRWVRVHWPYQRFKPLSPVAHLLFAVVQFPVDLFYALSHPMSTINLYISRVDVTFDQFRIRDAELIMQMIGIVGESMHVHNIQWQDVFTDAATQCLLGLVS